MKGCLNDGSVMIWLFPFVQYIISITCCINCAILNGWAIDSCMVSLISRFGKQIKNLHQEQIPVKALTIKYLMTSFHGSEPYKKTSHNADKYT
jgi:hypothetical protein